MKSDKNLSSNIEKLVTKYATESEAANKINDPLAASFTVDNFIPNLIESDQLDF